MSESDSGFKEFEKGARQTPINWKNQLKQIEDSYRDHRGIAHGVQKDGIQNPWDARNPDSEDDWKVEFRYISGEERDILVIEDYGTCGLTGPVKQGADYEEDLDEDDRWARFESLAFAKDNSSGKLGSRGQGKFIFVAASSKDVIVYDSLRTDGSYRAGYRRVKKTESPVNSWDGDKGREMFQDLTDGLLPDLDHVGTRVVIIDPTDEVIESLQSGRFEKYIAETWWELLELKNQTIEITIGEDSNTISAPEEFALPEDENGPADVWLKVDDETEGGFGVERIHFVHDDSQKISDPYRGVSFQRGGMKITSIQPRRRIPPEIANHLYGYVIFDDETEQELKKAENPEHYGFSSRYKVTKDVEKYIKDQIEMFAQERLGWSWSEGVENEQRLQTAELRALKQINSAFDDYEFFEGESSGQGSTKSTGGGNRDPKPVRVSMPEPEFPRDSPRVNYGEEIRNICVQVRNDLEIDLATQLRVDLEYRSEQLNETKKEITVPASDGDQPGKLEFGPFKIHIDESEFPLAGKYSLTAQLTALEDTEQFTRGEIIDTAQRPVYLETEPPAGDGPFADCRPVELKDSTVHGEITRTEKGEYRERIYEYNITHPEYDEVKEDTEASARYLFRIMTMDLLVDELNRGNADLFEHRDLSSPEGTADALVRKLGEINANYFR